MPASTAFKIWSSWAEGVEGAGEVMTRAVVTGATLMTSFEVMPLSYHHPKVYHNLA